MTHDEFIKDLGNYSKCRICGESIYHSHFPRHLKSHNLSPRDYYIKMVECKTVCSCGKDLPLTWLKRGLHKTCGDKECSSLNLSSKITESWQGQEERKASHSKKMTSLLQEPEFLKSLSKGSSDKFKNRDWLYRNCMASTLSRIKTPKCFTYLMYLDGYLKIGVTSDIRLRTRSGVLIDTRFMDTERSVHLEYIIKVSTDEIPEETGNGYTERRSLKDLDLISKLMDLTEDQIDLIMRN